MNHFFLWFGPHNPEALKHDSWLRSEARQSGEMKYFLSFVALFLLVFPSFALGFLEVTVEESLAALLLTVIIVAVLVRVARMNAHDERVFRSMAVRVALDKDYLRHERNSKLGVQTSKEAAWL